MTVSRQRPAPVLRSSGAATTAPPPPPSSASPPRPADASISLLHRLLATPAISRLLVRRHLPRHHLRLAFPTPSTPLFPSLRPFSQRFVSQICHFTTRHSLVTPSPAPDLASLAPPAPPFPGWGVGWQRWRILGDHSAKEEFRVDVGQLLGVIEFCWDVGRRSWKDVVFGLKRLSRGHHGGWFLGYKWEGSVSGMRLWVNMQEGS